MKQHAFVIEAGVEEGITAAQAWVTKELPAFAQGFGGHGGMKTHPDLIILRFGLFSVEDARTICESAAQAPFIGEHKVMIIAANRAYHEAQNALLKLFEEPPPSTYLFLILPSLGGLLPTLRSRVQILRPKFRHPMSEFGAAEEFMRAGKEKRSTIIKKLATGSDEEERRSNREEAIAIVNGIEAVAYASSAEKNQELLKDIQVLRSHLYDRSAPVRMILEHLSLVLPKNLI